MLGQLLALSKTPFDLLRGSGGEEKILKNAKDTCATEALEIATYAAIEHVAERVGDQKTARLAASIRADEEQMLARVMRELRPLSAAVVGAEVDGDPTYDVGETGAAEAVKATARSASATTKRTARQARKVPGVAQVEGEIKGAVASEQDLAIARYDQLTAEEIAGKLNELSQIELAKVNAYERKQQNRTTVLSRIDTLRGNEPWPGYDELGVQEIRIALSDADDDRTAPARLRAQPQEPRRRPQRRRARTRHRLNDTGAARGWAASQAQAPSARPTRTRREPWRRRFRPDAGDPLNMPSAWRCTQGVGGASRVSQWVRPMLR